MRLKHALLDCQQPVTCVTCAGREGLTLKEVCLQCKLPAKRFDKRFKFIQQHLRIVETEQQACLHTCAVSRREQALLPYLPAGMALLTHGIWQAVTAQTRHNPSLL